MSKIARALISVSDKTGVTELAAGLVRRGVEILSTGGTARLLREHDIAVLEVSNYTGFPEMMDGRVKTLHPKIYGGILARRGQDESAMLSQGILPIDMVVVNLYPFERTVAQADCDLPTAIENIDIGGPAMLRAGAKNYASVTVLVSPGDYQGVLEEMDGNDGGLSEKSRYTLALAAFEHTAHYDGAIAAYLGRQSTCDESDLPATVTLRLSRKQAMRYGENPHQNAAFYTQDLALGASVSTARQLQGKALSFNNMADTDAALECVKSFSEGPACVIVKHANPCGVAMGDTLLDAYERAFSTDPTSAFGGIIAFNGPLDADTARLILERQFVEVIIAPDVSEQALPVLATKQNVRVLACGAWTNDETAGLTYKHVRGGMLIQDEDTGKVTADALKIVTRRAPDERELRDLLFTWRVAKFVKSNAIVYGKEQMTIGVGAGQMSRVYSARIAAIKARDAGLEVRGSVMASDAFFPFRDGLDSAAEVGISAVIQPGGSMRDDEVIEAADQHGIAMVFTGMRHFRH